MSDVLIKGMDIPKSCYDCVQDDNSNDFYFLTNCHVWVDEICKGNINCENLPKDCRDSSCHLIEIPTPHGDLIDRDDVIDEINRITFSNPYDYNTAYNIVKETDTIIEAEVSEE